jgi:soluble lytic murein transglycosylase-like protein
MPNPALDALAPYEPIFQAASQSWNVDPLLLKALAAQESRGNPRAVSKAGAQGLMQIMPDTQKYLGVTDPFDPVQSIFGAAKYLSEGLDKEGSPEGALLYYHGGADWKSRFGPESAAYVPAVAGHYKALLAAQPAQAPPPPQPAVAPPDAAPTPSQQASP